MQCVIKKELTVSVIERRGRNKKKKVVHRFRTLSPAAVAIGYSCLPPAYKDRKNSSAECALHCATVPRVEYLEQISDNSPFHSHNNA